MKKSAAQWSAFSFQQLAVLVVAVVVFAGFIVLRVSQGDWHDAYYRGVYETCVRESVVNGQVTQFDLRMCEELETRARKEGWMEEELVRP